MIAGARSHRRARPASRRRAEPTRRDRRLSGRSPAAEHLPRGRALRERMDAGRARRRGCRRPPHAAARTRRGPRGRRRDGGVRRRVAPGWTSVAANPPRASWAAAPAHGCVRPARTRRAARRAPRRHAARSAHGSRGAPSPGRCASTAGPPMPSPHVRARPRSRGSSRASNDVGELRAWNVCCRPQEQGRCRPQLRENSARTAPRVPRLPRFTAPRCESRQQMNHSQGEAGASLAAPLRVRPSSTRPDVDHCGGVATITSGAGLRARGGCRPATG